MNGYVLLRPKAGVLVGHYHGYGKILLHFDTAFLELAVKFTCLQSIHSSEYVSGGFYWSIIMQTKLAQWVLGFILLS